jgi:hypothetical protein
VNTSVHKKKKRDFLSLGLREGCSAEMEQAGKVGMGGEVPRARRRVSRTAVLMAAAVVVLSVCCLTLSDLEAAPVEAVSVAGNDVEGPLNDDTERIIKSAVQKAVSVRIYPLPFLAGATVMEIFLSYYGRRTALMGVSCEDYWT